jgi:hypothetical protein
MKLPSLLLAFGLACVSSARAASDQVDFGKLADGYFAKHKIEGKAPAETAMEDVLGTHYLLAEIGALDLRFPREFLDEKSAVDDFKTCLTAALQIHEVFLDWIGASGEAADKARADAADLRKFLKTARVAPGSHEAGSFFEALGGASSIAPVVARFRDGFRGGASLGFEPLSGRVQIVMVAPTRQHFLELAGVLGQIQEGARSLYWNDQLINWTEFGWNEIQVVATQYPPLRVKTDDFSEGVAMNAKEATGLQQHVGQRVGMALCWYAFGSSLDPAFELAIAQTMVIDVYGENNTRSGGSGRSNFVGAMEAFIPGGNSNGGALPPGNAESAWRSTNGKDYFVKPLAAGQSAGAKGGAKLKEEKQSYFELHGDDTSGRFYVRAPFLGSAAQGKELPAAEFLSDYLEFFRAYKTGFVHWLREKSSAKPGEAKALFAKLLREVAVAGGGASFEEVVAEVYKVPYSAVDFGKDTLERRFLAWLDTQ